MARRGRPTLPIVLTEVERETLERYVRRGKTAQRLALRSKIVLLAAEGKTGVEIASTLGLTCDTVSKWRKRFVQDRLGALGDAPRSGRPRTVDDDRVEECIRRTLETQPTDSTHWSTRSMAKRTGISNATVGRIWRAFGLKPHRFKTFALSTDPDFIEKVHDIAGLYMNPPHNAVVLCVDEKTQVQALDRRQPLLPMMPGHEARGNHDYLRCGTTDLFAALDVATGAVIGQCYPRHRATDFRKFLNHVDKSISPEITEIHVILDNQSTHKTKIIRNWFARRPRYHVHFTPTHSSWMNLVEVWFSILTRKQLKRGVHRSTAELKSAIKKFIETTNEDPKPFVWTRSAEAILSSIARRCERLRGVESGLAS